MNMIKIFLWDLDGVHYPYNDAFHEMADRASAAVAVKHIAGMEFDRAVELSASSRKKYNGSSFQTFVTDYGADLRTFMEEFHDNLSVDFIEPASDQFKENMAQCAVEHALLTHANTKWAKRVLERLELKQFFKDDMIFTSDHISDKKSESPKPFLIVAEKLGRKPEEVLMIEDTQKNLYHAKLATMQTLLVHPKETDMRESFTDSVFPTPALFLDHYAKNKRVLAL